jgi:hypothetical protein
MDYHFGGWQEGGLNEPIWRTEKIFFRRPTGSSLQNIKNPRLQTGVFNSSLCWCSSPTEWRKAARSAHFLDDPAGRLYRK